MTPLPLMGEPLIAERLINRHEVLRAMIGLHKARLAAATLKTGIPWTANVAAPRRSRARAGSSSVCFEGRSSSVDVSLFIWPRGSLYEEERQPVPLYRSPGTRILS
jgi:hypothetical protein